MNRFSTSIVAALVLLLGSVAQAQVHRCVVNGRITYGSTPCNAPADGAADAKGSGAVPTEVLRPGIRVSRDTASKDTMADRREAERRQRAEQLRRNPPPHPLVCAGSDGVTGCN